MKTSAVFGLSLVIITMTSVACGSTKHSNANETTFNDGEKVTVQSQTAGVITCEERNSIRPQAMEGLPILEAEISEPAQKVIRKYCQGEPKLHTEFSPVNLDLKPVLGSANGDIVVVRNLTTCTERTRSYGSEQMALQSMGQDDSALVPFNQVRSVSVLPLGQELIETPTDLALDPSRANLIEIELKLCEKWQAEGDLKVCAEPVTISKKQIVIKVKEPTKYHRGIRIDVDKCG